MDLRTDKEEKYLPKKDTVISQEYVINLVAHVNHGKTTVMDNVLEYIGVLTKSMAGEARLLDSRKDELERGMTMKLSPVTMRVQNTKLTFLDTPGHLEFNSLTESTFIVSDVSLVILDVVKGVTERLRQLVRKTVENRCRIVLLINKADLLFRMGVPVDEIEHRVFSAVSEISHIIDKEISWETGTVILGSAKENWAICKDSDPSRLLGRAGSVASVRKALSLLRAVYAQGDKEISILAERIGKKRREGIKEKIEPKDIISHEFEFFNALYLSIDACDASYTEYQRRSQSAPDEVLAVVCANTMVGGEVTAIARTLYQRRIAVGDLLTVTEQGSEIQRQVTGIIYFTASIDRARTGTGLIGIQGIDCRKRGILSSSRSEPEKVQKYFHSLKWPVFTPLFTDVIIPAPEDYDSVIERLTCLSRCEPGLFIIVKSRRVIVKSDGVLQMDKIRTDLEGLKYSTEEQSEIYQETVEGGHGVVSSPLEMDDNKNFAVFFRRVISSDNKNNKELDVDGLDGFKKVFGRECYVKYTEEVPSSLRMSISSLLQNGPFIMEPCNMVSVEVFPTDKAVTGTVAQVYMESHPRILVNHTVLRISLPSVYTKGATHTISKSFGHILSTDIEENTVVFTVRIPVSKIKDLTNTLRTQTKGEADILPTNMLYQIVPDKKEYERALTEEIRERKGISQKDRID